MSANKQCVTRLQKEYKSLLKEPVPNITAHPSPQNLLEWHFVLEGTKGTEFEGGVYHGKLVFPPQYPFKPPSISLFTPNGRFATNTKLCLSMTDFHPESWNPMWSVGTILTGLLSFMYDSQPTTGSITSTREEKTALSKESLAFNMKNLMFKKLFPEWVEEYNRRMAATPAAEPAQPPEVRNGTPQQPLQPAAQPTGAAQQQAHGDQQRQVAAGAAGAHEPPQQQQPQPSSSLWTIAVIAVVLAVMVVPLVTNTKGPGGGLFGSMSGAGHG